MGIPLAMQLKTTVCLGHAVIEGGTTVTASTYENAIPLILLMDEEHLNLRKFRDGCACNGKELSNLVEFYVEFYTFVKVV